MNKKIPLAIAGLVAALILMVSGLSYRNQAAKLVQASLDNDLPEVERLLAEGTDINRQVSNGSTALMAAAHKGYLEVARRLIEARADVNLTTQTGMTALMYASWKGYNGMAKLLLDNGADIDARRHQRSHRPFRRGR